jgi:hypothetical protein
MISLKESPIQNYIEWDFITCKNHFLN